MKKLYLIIATLVGLVCLAPAASAGDRGYRGNSDHYISDRWKLGERYRGGHAIYAWDGRHWERMPGSAIDIAQGWVIGTDRRGGGYGIYRWNGYGWGRVPGGAISIGGSYERPWVINDHGEKFYWNGHDWDRDRNYRNEGHGNDRSYNRNSYSPRNRAGQGQEGHEGHGRQRRRGW